MTQYWVEFDYNMAESATEATNSQPVTFLGVPWWTRANGGTENWTASFPGGAVTPAPYYAYPWGFDASGYSFAIKGSWGTNGFTESGIVFFNYTISIGSYFVVGSQPAPTVLDGPVLTETVHDDLEKSDVVVNWTEYAWAIVSITLPATLTVTPSTTATFNLSEQSNGNISTGPQTFPISFTDTDTAARPQISFESESVSATDALGHVVNLTAPQISALEGAGTFGTPTNGNNGSISFAYNPQGTSLNFLTGGEKAVVNYSINVADQDGNNQVSNVVVTVNGAPDNIHLNVALGSGGFGTITALNYGQPLSVSSTGGDQANVAFDDLMPVPAGTWNAVFYYSPNPNIGYCLSLSSSSGTSDFNDRDNIEIHIGNTSGDSSGCIVTGNGSVNGVATNGYWTGLLANLETELTVPVANLAVGQYDAFQTPVTVTVSGNTTQPTLQNVPAITALRRGASDVVDFKITGLQPTSPVVDKTVDVYFEILDANEQSLDQTPSLVTTGATLQTSGAYAGLFDAKIVGTNQTTATGYADQKVTLNTAGVSTSSLTINIVHYAGTSFETNGSTVPYNPLGGAIGVQPMLEGNDPVNITFLSPAKASALNNLDGSGTSDVLWYNASTGDVGDWSMNNGQPQWQGLSGSLASWKIQGDGDFTGNGTSDVLWRNTSTGEVLDWIMNNNQPQQQLLGYGSTTMNVAGIGDFFGNGTSDILWQNPTNNLVGEWQMNNNVPTWQLVGQGSTTMNIAGIGDFNGDGKSDILWENPTNNLVGMWGMNGSTPTWSLIDQGSTTMKIVGVGDFTGSGTDDILWENPTNGVVGFWGMNNGQDTSWNLVGTASTAYQVAGIGDYYGNGTSDILWRNPTSGDTGIWAMNNGKAVWNDLGASSTAYNIVKS